MENKAFFKETDFKSIVGNWAINVDSLRFKFNNDGIKLVALKEENLSKIIFDLDKMTIQVIVDTPTLNDRAPRIADVSDTPTFFNEIRDNFENIISFFNYKPFTVNEDRTVFSFN